MTPTWPHQPSPHTDYVAIPPLEQTVCLHCEVGDGYQEWPCESERWRLAANPAPAGLPVAEEVVSVHRRKPDAAASLPVAGAGTVPKDDHAAGTDVGALGVDSVGGGVGGALHTLQSLDEPLSYTHCPGCSGWDAVGVHDPGRPCDGVATNPAPAGLDDIIREVEDWTDYPNHDDEETFADGWRNRKAAILDALRGARTHVAANPAPAGLDVERLARAMDIVDYPVTGDEPDAEDRAEHRAYAADLAAEYAALANTKESDGG